MLFLPKEKGQGMVEYALILVLVAIVVIVALQILGPAWPYIARFFARNWPWGLLVLLFYFADVVARLTVNKIKRNRNRGEYN